MPDLCIRRATVDDLDILRAIWSSMRLSTDDREKRLKEYQVVEADGHVVGVIGLQMSGQYALLHSEGYSDFSVADRARELFWERIQTLAANHGVFRLWTQEESPFWVRWGFQSPSPEILSRLPEQWQNDGKWLTLPLKDEDAIAAALNDQFADFMTAEKKQTAELLDHSKKLSNVITVGGFAVFFICMAILAYLILHKR